MIVHVNPEGVTRNIIPFVDDSRIRTEIMKTQALKQALDQHEFDVWPIILMFTLRFGR